MARYSEIKNILKTHNLRITDGRIDVLEYFTREKRTLSIKDLQIELKVCSIRFQMTVAL